MKKSEETKRKIIEAAETLFLNKGYSRVTMREIAKQAACSHTTIYLYFSDKEALLHDIAMPYLEKLKRELESIKTNDSFQAEKTLKRMCLAFIRFGLINHNMYSLFIFANGSRVDEREPIEKTNKIRIILFRYLTEVIGNCLPGRDEEELLSYARILFFYLHGSVSTYSGSEESFDELWSRLSDTFETGIHIFLKGFQGREGERFDEA